MVDFNTFLEKHPDLKTIVYAGKGGTGKSTLSAATALEFARRGLSTLCFSTDPQASLSDVFKTDLFGKGETKLRPNLACIEIDADRRIEKFKQETREKIEEMHGEVPEEIDEYIEGISSEPAMHESAAHDAMAELLAEGKYDRYILDMPPFGHGVRMVSMSKILDKWVNRIEKTRREISEIAKAEEIFRGETARTGDEILKVLTDVKNKMDFFAETLTNPEASAFVMVLTPERMAVLDTRKVLKLFEGLGIKLGGVVVNMCYPSTLLEEEDLSESLKNRVETQQKRMKQIEDELGEYLRAVVPTFRREPRGFEMLGKVADHLFETPVRWYE